MLLRLPNFTHAAIFTIAGSHRSLGIIISANANAAKLFGYSRLQLERRNVFTLLSEPLSSRHESLLRSYVDSGEGAIMSTSPTLGITKNGVLLPLLVSIREPPPSDAAPTFLVMMRDIRTQDQHMLLREDGTIVGASSGSCQVSWKCCVRTLLCDLCIRKLRAHAVI